MKYVLLVLSFAIQFSILHAVERDGFSVKKDVAQYKYSDYSNVVQVARGLSLELAFDIAESNPDIDYFVYTKGGPMVLEISAEAQFDPLDDPFGLSSKINYMFDSEVIGKGYCRVFNQGDVVFFKKDGMWLGSAHELADTYFKD